MLHVRAPALNQPISADQSLAWTVLYDCISDATIDRAAALALKPQIDAALASCTAALAQLDQKKINKMSSGKAPTAPPMLASPMKGGGSAVLTGSNHKSEAGSSSDAPPAKKMKL